MKSRSVSVAAMVVLYATCVAGQTKRETAPLTPLSKPSGNPWAQSGGLTRSVRDIAIYRAAAPAVVLIVTPESFGSGSLIGAGGEVLTNWHVVNGASEVVVVFKPQAEGVEPTREDVRKGTVIKFDQVADLALVKVESMPGNRPAIKLGDDIDISVGADVHAIGHPTGQAWTYTTGIVSQIRAGYDWSYGPTDRHKADVIQTQTPISPGNSGGPLLSDAGTLVGVNCFGNSSVQSLNFAVSVKDVKAFLLRKGDKRATAETSADDHSGPSSFIDRRMDVQVVDVRAPYASLRPQSRVLLLANSSSTPIRAVTVGALEIATTNRACPPDSSMGYPIKLLFEVTIPPKGSVNVTGDFTPQSQFFCVVRAQ